MWTFSQYSEMGFPNQFFCNSWAVGLRRTEHAHGPDGKEWTIVLQVFERRARGAATRAGTIASFSKRCTISRFTTSRGALFRRFGHWNSVWKRFWRLSRTGTFEAFFDALAAMSETAHLVQMFNSTVVRAHVSAAGAKKDKDQALGRCAAASRRKSTSRSISMGCRSPFI